jgi:putative transposase
MQRFKSPGQAQRFLAVHSQVHNLFRVGRHLPGAANYRMFTVHVTAETSV